MMARLNLVTDLGEVEDDNSETLINTIVNMGGDAGDDQGQDNEQVRTFFIVKAFVINTACDSEILRLGQCFLW